METPKFRFRTVLFAVVLLPVFAGYALLNSLFLTVGDLLGVYRRRALSHIRRAYGWQPSDTSSAVSACWSDYVLRRVGVISGYLAPQGWETRIEAQIVVLTRSSFGICIPHRTAQDQHSNRAKRLYYLQGSHFEMGYLLGLMAEKDVARMAVDYVDNVIFDFAGDKGKHPFLGTIIANFIYRLAAVAKAHLPPELNAELYGIYAGCVTADPSTKVLVRDLLVLNYGVDVILSLVYAGAERILRFFGVDVERWKNPAACNGFIATGEAGGGRTFMGRDFMFPTCNVFGDTAAPILYFSDGRLGSKDGPGRALEAARAGAGRGTAEARFWDTVPDAPLPCLVFTAPGMVGAVTALNQHGVAMGVDMVNGRNCRWRNVGINSLLMVRHTVQRSRNAEEAVARIRATRRGVTWIYLIGDGGSNTGVVVEAGASGRNRNLLRYVPPELRKRGLLPTQDFIDRNCTHSRFSDGMGERWPGWRLQGKWIESEISGRPEPWGRFNESLFRCFDLPLQETEWGETGKFGADQHDRVIPNAYYFAPQRQFRDDVVVVTNQFLLPEMRLLAMNEWTAHFATAAGNYHDFQWRYDVLNRKLHDELAKSGALTLDTTQEVIDFLRPYELNGAPAEHHNYYGVYHDRVSLPTDVPIGGAVCAFDLTDLTMRVHYGWYSDPWVEVAFKPFV
jgi:hypothetical protein